MMFCTKYVKELGRICDKPATNNNGGHWRCDEHHPYLYIENGKIVPSPTKNREKANA